jgi:hypothetical protein
MDLYPVEEKPLTLRLEGADAVVLFALLQRFQVTGKLELDYEAERRLLLSMFDVLEGEVRAPLEPHYDRVLESARARVAQKRSPE